MFAAGKWALFIVTGGLALGAFLGDAANPTIKDPTPRWWQLTGRDEIVPSSDHAFFEAGPEDLNPFGGYRPDLDYDAEVWALPVSADEMAPLAEEPAAPAADELPSVTYGVEADVAANEAEAAVNEALAAATAPIEARRPEPAVAGIY